MYIPANYTQNEFTPVIACVNVLVQLMTLAVNQRRNVSNQERTSNMAKKTKTVENPAVETPATDAAPAVEKGANDRFVRLFIDGPNGSVLPAPALKADGTVQKVAPQLQAIANTLEAIGAAGCTRAELVAALSVEGVLTTKQPVGRILSYYQKDLVKFGLAERIAA